MNCWRQKSGRGKGGGRGRWIWRREEDDENKRIIKPAITTIKGKWETSPSPSLELSERWRHEKKSSEWDQFEHNSKVTKCAGCHFLSPFLSSLLSPSLPPPCLFSTLPSRVFLLVGECGSVTQAQIPMWITQYIYPRETYGRRSDAVALWRAFLCMLFSFYLRVG